MSLKRLKVPRKTLLNDLVSGIVMALVSVPGGLANGLLAGVNPIYGLYSINAGTTVAALLVMSLCFCLWKCFLHKEGEIIRVTDTLPWRLHTCRAI